MSEVEIRDRVRVQGEEHLLAARARGRGVFLLSAHFGGWELGAIRAGLIGEPIRPSCARSTTRSWKRSSPGGARASATA